jgi:hypothetical protein
VWDRNEVETIYAIAKKLDHEDDAYGEIEDSMNHGPECFFEELSKLTDPVIKDLVMEVMLMTVSVDQKFDRKESAFLKKCAEAMGMDFHIGRAKKRMKKLFM